MSASVADPHDGALDPRSANSYDFVRFCAASGVLFSHHFALTGQPEPKVPGYGEDFGEVAVEVFFCLSGFLICRSLQKSPSWMRFAAARLLRIFPNLLFVLLVSSATTLVWYRNYPNLGAHVTYVTDNLLMFVTGVTFVIPGVFTDALDPEVNNPLWTLPYELWCYALLALTFVFGIGYSRAFIVIVMLLIGVAWSAMSFANDFDIGPFEASEFLRFGSYFMSGAVLAVAWPWIARYAIIIGVVGLLTGLAVRNLLEIDTLLHSLALAACVIGLGSSSLMAWFSRGGDPSYGMYVFAWPVQQFALLIIESFWQSLAVAFFVTAAIGYATWHAFEKRAVALPKRAVPVLAVRRSL